MPDNMPDFNKKQKIIASVVVAILILAVPLSRLIFKNNSNDTKSDPDFQVLIDGFEMLEESDREKLIDYMNELLRGNPDISSAEINDEAISWLHAGDYIGENRTVEGVVVRSYNSGKACFLNFHEDYKTYFTAVIFKSAFDEFPDNPEDFYLGKTIQVTGEIKEYNGAPEIILETPSQIAILEE